MLSVTFNIDTMISTHDNYISEYQDGIDASNKLENVVGQVRCRKE